MKRKINLLFSLILVIALSFQMPVLANDTKNPEVDTSKINPYVLPSYVEGTSLNDAGFSKRLLEYDSADKLNVIGFETIDNNNIVKLFPYNVKYIENNSIIDKNPDLTENGNSLFSNENYAYRNTSNNIKLFIPKNITETPIKIKSGNSTIKVKPVTYATNSSDASLLNNNTVSYNNVFSLNDTLNVKSDYSGIQISSVENLHQTDNYNLDLEGFDVNVAGDGTIILTAENGDKYSIIAHSNSGDFTEMSISLSSNNSSQYTLCVNAVTAYTITITEISQSIISDAPVYSFFPTNALGNFGSANIGTSSPYQVGRMYVKFDISALSNISYDKIISAYYRVSKVGESDMGKRMDAHLVLGDWQEDTITWDTKPSYNSERLCTVKSNEDASSTYDGVNKNDFYITHAVQAWLQGVNNYGIIIKEREDKGSVKYAQKESASSYPCSLNVLYVEESSSVQSRGIGDGTYYIKSKINDMFMTASGTSVVQKNLLTDPSSQIWNVEYEGNGYYTISPLSDASKIVKNTANISLSEQSYTNSSTLWKIRRNWDGSYSILSKENNDTKDISVGVNYSTEGMNLIYSNDSMGIRKHDDWTFIPSKKGNANVFGFCPGNHTLGNVIPTKSISDKTSNKLNQLGYNSLSNINADAFFAKNKMSSSNIFVYYGHGESGLLSFTFYNEDGSLNESFLTGGPTGRINNSMVASLHSLTQNALKNQTLALFDSCLSGRDLPEYNEDGSSSSLIGMTYFKGSHFVIGFNNITRTDMSNYVDAVLYTKLLDGENIYNALDYLDENIDEFIVSTGKDESCYNFIKCINYRTWMGDNSLVYILPNY